MRKENMNCKENCKGIGELLTAYLDGEVTEKEKAIVESHLADCRQCKAELEALKATQVSLKSVLTSMAEEVVPSTEAWRNIRAKIEKKDSWLESLGNMFSNQKWQGVAITATVVVVAVSVTVWQISGAGQSPSLVAPPTGGNTSAVPTPPKSYDTPTAPPPAQVTVNPPSVTVPSMPSPAPAPPPPSVPTTPPPPSLPPPVTPPATTPPATTPPITVGAPPPTVNVAPPPPSVTIQAPPPAQVTVQPPPPSQINPPAVTVQPPPPAHVIVNVPQQPPLLAIPSWVWLLPVILIVGVIIAFIVSGRAKPSR